jgi:hypothetical protein
MRWSLGSRAYVWQLFVWKASNAANSQDLTVCDDVMTETDSGSTSSREHSIVFDVLLTLIK